MLLQDEPTQQSAYSQLQGAYLFSIALQCAHQEIDTLNRQVTLLEEENVKLKEQLRLAALRQFGKSSERKDPEPLDTTPPDSQTVTSYTRKKSNKSRGRNIDTSSLPRHVIVHDLAETEKCCPECHQSLVLMDKETAEQLEVLPMQLYVAEHVRYKYCCRSCESIQMAPKESSALPKALAGNSLLAEILVNKYQYHLPLYRQSKILLRHGADIPDNTLGNWVMQVGNGLEKIYDALMAAVLANGYLQVDETPVKILKPDKQGYLWSYFAPELSLIFFECSLTRSSSVAENRLSDYKGLLQTDGYAGYQKLRERAGVVGLGCLSHARRKFSEIFKINQDPDGIAASALERLKPLYALEERLREAKVTSHTRKRLRQK